MASEMRPKRAYFNSLKTFQMARMRPSHVLLMADTVKVAGLPKQTAFQTPAGIPRQVMTAFLLISTFVRR